MKIDEMALIKVALEYAKFDDWRIREGVNDLLKALDADLIDVQFEASVNTRQVADELSGNITDIESGLQPEQLVSAELEEDDDDETLLEISEDDDDEDDELKLDENEDDLEEDRTQQSHLKE